MFFFGQLRWIRECGERKIERRLKKPKISIKKIIRKRNWDNVDKKRSLWFKKKKNNKISSLEMLRDPLWICFLPFLCVFLLCMCMRFISLSTCFFELHFFLCLSNCERKGNFLGLVEFGLRTIDSKRIQEKLDGNFHSLATKCLIFKVKNISLTLHQWRSVQRASLKIMSSHRYYNYSFFRFPFVLPIIMTFNLFNSQLDALPHFISFLYLFLHSLAGFFYEQKMLWLKQTKRIAGWWSELSAHYQSLTFSMWWSSDGYFMSRVDIPLE